MSLLNTKVSCEDLLGASETIQDPEIRSIVFDLLEIEGERKDFILRTFKVILEQELRLATLEERKDKKVII
jgi:hypothetical protein